MGFLSQGGPSFAAAYSVLETRWLPLASALLACSAFLPAALCGQTAGEYEVKAVFLYKFASFVEWPPQPETVPVCIGIMGQDPFGAVLDQVVKGKSINGRPFLVRRFGPGQNPGDCHIVFIGASEKKQVRSILDRLQGAAVLTVGEVPEFCQNGGVINFALRDGRVQFEINLDAAARARIKVSSKLLSVARIARDGGLR